MQKIYLFLICLQITLLFGQQNINGTMHDLNQFPGSYPKGLKLIGNDLLFSSKTSYSYNEPFKYNVVTKKLTLIKEDSQTTPCNIVSNEFYEINQKIFFLNSNSSNLELFELNLATNSVTKIKVIATYYSSDKLKVKVYNNKLFIVLKDKLYVSDGTAAGTSQITKMQYVSENLAEKDGSIYFFGSNGSSGKELWKSDGTATGTTLVKDLTPYGSSAINGNEYVYNINGQIVFPATAEYNYGLWSTDGTDAGTIKFFDFSGGNLSFAPFENTGSDKLIFKNNNQLWITDGTENGTKATETTSGYSLIKKLISFKDKTFISTDNKIYYKNKSDLIQELPTYLNKSLDIITVSSEGNFLIFKDQDLNKPQLYFYDGQNFKDIGVNYGEDAFYLEKEDKIYFAGFTEKTTSGYDTAKNIELFHYQKSTNLAGLEHDIFSGLSSKPRYFIQNKNEVYFIANDGVYDQVFKIDAGQKITKLSNLSTRLPDNYLLYHPMMKSGNEVYFRAEGLIRTSGTVATTAMISLPAGERLMEMYPLNDHQVILKSYHSLNGFMRIWRLDNNSNTPVLLVEQPADGVYSTVYDQDFLTTATGIYFKMMEYNINQIWKTDGTIGGTKKITNLIGIYAHKQFLSVLNDKVFFTDGSYGSSQLNYIDDSSKLVNYVTDVHYIEPHNSFIINDRLNFFSSAVDGVTKYYLSSTDGTAAGTVRTKEIGQSISSGEMEKCDQAFYFLPMNNTTALWRSDGTATGTYKVYDTNSQSNYWPKCLNKELYTVRDYAILTKTNGQPGNRTDVSMKVEGEIITPNTQMMFLYSDGKKLYSSTTYKNWGAELFVSEVLENLATSNDYFSPSKSTITLYPNPAKDVVTIKLDTSETILHVGVTDVSGRLLLSENNSTINVTSLNAGVYFITIKTSGKIYSSKLIKK